jgi:pimeloyl-ACP methyl ester carboxylesterase
MVWQTLYYGLGSGAAGTVRMDDNGLKFLHIGESADRRSIAVHAQAGAPLGLFWLSGYNSDMNGTKAQALARWAEQNGRACLRFD